jgi:hypothetical protein
MPFSSVLGTGSGSFPTGRVTIGLPGRPNSASTGQRLFLPRGGKVNSAPPFFPISVRAVPGGHRGPGWARREKSSGALLTFPLVGRNSRCPASLAGRSAGAERRQTKAGTSRQRIPTMANTTEENALVQRALLLVRMRYGEYLPTSTFFVDFYNTAQSRKPVDRFVQFMSPAAFASAFYVAGLKRKSGCTICAFTAPKKGASGEWEICVSRTLANPTTIVHELLHFFTHPTVFGKLSAEMNEGITEYFTRKCVNQAVKITPKKAEKDTGSETAKKAEKDIGFRDFEMSGRAGHYDQHHNLVSLARDGLKKVKQRGKGYMKRAYFQGNPDALNLIVQHMGSFDALLEELEET